MNVTTQPLDTQVRATIGTLLTTLCAAYGLTPVPRLEWSRRMRSMLGNAYLRENRIQLSAWLDGAQADDTLRHELAHIAAERPAHGPGELLDARASPRPAGTVQAAWLPGTAPVRGVRHGPHGARWRAWALRLGATPRALSKAPPALAPRREPRGMRWGLACAGCGLRFVRLRLARGLYHTACGPGRGALRRIMRADYAAVAAWARDGGEQARLFKP